MELLVTEGATTVKATGTTAASVAADIVSARWSSMSDSVRRELATLGLAKAINDQMARERAKEEEHKRKEIDEAMKPYYEQQARFDQERQKIQAERQKSREKQAALDAEKLKDAPPYEEEIERIHGLLCCPYKGCRESFGKRERCVLLLNAGSDPRLVHREELDKKIADRRECNEAPFRSTMNLIHAAHDLGWQAAVDNLRSIMLISSDGSMKSLLDFSLEDARQWKRKSRANRLSWKARQEFFEAAEAMLVEAAVDTVCDLAPEKIKELAESARGIWKKQPPCKVESK